MFSLDTKHRDWLLIGGGVVIALALIAAVRWRQDILQAGLDPKTPYQVYRPPPAPDYGRRAAWALLPAAPDRWSASDPPADVFFVHPTTFDGGKDWNGPIDDPKALQFLDRVVLPDDAGPFLRVGRLFAPRYRQASVFAQLTFKDDARDARQFAYGDVKRAFEAYLSRFNGGRPIVLAGVEQGGGLVARLAHDEVAANPTLASRIAAVYLIDTVVPRDDYKAGAPLPACQHPGQPRCVVAWLRGDGFDGVAADHAMRRALVWGADGRLENLHHRDALCVNPLLGAETNDPAPVRLNRGAAAANGLKWGVRPALRPQQVSAQCIGGVLQVSAPRSPSLQRTGGWLERLKSPGFNLFYADIEADAQARVAGLNAQPGFRRLAPPITRSEFVRAVPVR